MTREQAKELLPIIQAFVDGKTIEARTDSISKWIETTTPKFDLLHEYRIKPEPKYRPFETMEECWQEMQKHQPFGYIYFADENLYHNIIMLAPEKGCNEAYIRIGNCTVRGLEEAFRISTFADGTPFGVKVK